MDKMDRTALYERIRAAEARAEKAEAERDALAPFKAKHWREVAGWLEFKAESDPENNAQQYAEAARAYADAIDPGRGTA
ncbi:hypothetical protein [Kushneria phosphatilytica]|uniref:Uncharacterized protein n=1 Tax=Kushneria phosphatilytica TaxID=657387 RepID=A0A1S1NXH6_9GAMM|nr:hypothetical protein [Kushneria phosphatilytica]OHV12137.1 hypothetical protein BH688_05650 [Kushneria phosphatilytica]QEL11330.1 hypothetical protein FY550_09390 [Kushneria phosphatilytica]